MNGSTDSDVCLLDPPGVVTAFGGCKRSARIVLRKNEDLVYLFLTLISRLKCKCLNLGYIPFPRVHSDDSDLDTRPPIF